MTLPVPTRRPGLALVIDNAISTRLLAVHTGLPGKIVAWDPASQLADVKPLVQAFELQPDETYALKPLPVITSVPFVFPGNGLMGVTWPVAVNDLVWLKFSEASIDGYMQSGQDSQPIDAGRFGLSGCVAEPGPRPRSAPLPTPDPSAIFIGQYGTVADYVALAAKVDAQFAALQVLFNAFTPTGTTADGPALKTLMTALIATGWPLTTASTTVKASQ